MTRIRIFILIGSFALLIVLIPNRADSFGFDDIELNIGSSSDSQCNNVDIQGILDRLDSSFEDRMLDEIRNSFSPKQLLPLISQIIQCYVSDLQILEFGSGIGSPGNASCTRSIGGKIEAQISTQYKDRMRQEFLESCESQVNLDMINDDFNRIMNENGRDGGPMWVRNWDDFINQSQNRGVEIARNQMANTRYCPWLQGDMQAIFNFSPADAVDMVGEWVDTGGTSADANSCSLPDGFDIYNPAQQGSAVLAAVTLPQNNIYGSYLAGLGALNESVRKTSLADQFEFVYTGGLGAAREQNPQTGDSCLIRSPNGQCLSYSSIIKAGGAVQADVQAVSQTNLDEAAEAKAATTDVRSKMASFFLDMTQPPLSFEYGTSLGLRDAASRTPSPVTPTPTPASGTIPTACQNLPDDCACVVNDSSSQALASSVVLAAENSVIAAHPEMLNPDGVSLIPGQNIPFLDAVCASSAIPANTCRARAGSETDIVINVGGMDFDINILTSTGFIRRPGQVIAACTAGVL